MKFSLKKILMQKKTFVHLVQTSEQKFSKIFLESKNTYGEDLIFINLYGQKMKTKKNLFDEFNKLLHFPIYFGNNWDAFDECINDLTWLGLNKHGYVFFISKSLSILNAETTKDFSIFINIIKDIVFSENKANKKSFYFIFQETGDSFIQFQRKISEFLPNSEFTISFQI
jgi:RNAse (barnase) inhibitor barstar